MEQGADRRWLVIATVVGLAVVGFLGLRLIDGGGVRSMEPSAATPTTIEPTTTLSAAPQLVMSEEQLRTANDPDHDRAIALRAEWFVTDFFTRDGSEETVRSIRAALAAGAAPLELARGEEEGVPQTYVEWARTVDIGVAEGQVRRVTVLYRVIESIEGSFVRQPVRAAVVDIELVDGVPMVAAVPTPAASVWPGAAVPSG